MQLTCSSLTSCVARQTLKWNERHALTSIGDYSFFTSLEIEISFQLFILYFVLIVPIKIGGKKSEAKIVVPIICSTAASPPSFINRTGTPITYPTMHMPKPK